MRSSNGIEVIFLHFEQICPHIGNTHNTPRFAVEVVAIYAIEHNALAVHKEISTFDRHIAKTNALGKAFNDSTIGVFKFNVQVI